MSDEEACGRFEYLNRARTLRETAAQVDDRAVMEALISSAEAYERMAAWLVEAEPQDTPDTEDLNAEYPVRTLGNRVLTILGL